MSFIGGLLSSKTEAGDVQDIIKSPGLQTNNPFTQSFNQTAEYQQRQANELAGYANNGAQAGTAAQQQGFINQLQAQAMGQGPSVAQAMLNNSLQQNTANTNALAASARGNTNPVLAQRMAMQQNAQANQNTAQQGATARMQEQLNSQGLLGNNLSAMRSQDLQNSGMFNQLAQSEQGMALNNQNAGLNAANINLNNQMSANKMNADIATGNTASQNAATQGIVGGLINAGGAVAAKAAAAAYTGGIIPGKSEVKGDSLQNDKVPTMLSPGEIVIPRTMASDAEKAKAFVDHLLSNKSKSADKTGYSKVLEAKRMLTDMHQRIKKLESKIEG